MGRARRRSGGAPGRAVHAAAGAARRRHGGPVARHALPWGGNTCRGIDCSALVQVAYAVSGYSLPRDADQQWAALPQAVPRDALATGDLLFFARDDAVTHVALSLGGEAYVHALGEPPLGVCIQSLDPTAPDYNARVAAQWLGARRLGYE